MYQPFSAGKGNAMRALQNALSLLASAGFGG
jgi:hypothetical protein